MITQKKIARYFNIIIAVVLIIATMMNLSSLIDNLSSPPMVIALICLTLIYAMANVAKGRAQRILMDRFYPFTSCHCVDYFRFIRCNPYYPAWHNI